MGWWPSQLSSSLQLFQKVEDSMDTTALMPGTPSTSQKGSAAPLLKRVCGLNIIYWLNAKEPEKAINKLIQCGLCNQTQASWIVSKLTNTDKVGREYILSTLTGYLEPLSDEEEAVLKTCFEFGCRDV